MKPTRLSLSAASSEELFAQLRATDIAVPLVTEGRTKEHRERYVMARFLATAAKTGMLTFPLNVAHREKPDFSLRFGGSEVGVECVEAVPQELYEIEVLREKWYPEAMNFGQKFQPGSNALTRDEKHQIASGCQAGPPWMPEAAKRNWVSAMLHVISGKAVKLQSGNYSSNATNWLLVQDVWPTSLRSYPEQVREAALECAQRLAAAPDTPSFDALFIASGRQLLCIERGTLTTEDIYDLWS